MWLELLISLQWICFIFFLGLVAGYIFLICLTLAHLPGYVRKQILDSMPQTQTDYCMPISIVVPAYNEEAIIVNSVRSLLQIDYPEFEIVVVNDGSKDATEQKMVEAFKMIPIPLAIQQRLPHQPITAFFQSTVFPSLKMVTKINGGCKSDATNTGIDTATYSLVCPLDADSVMDKDCLKHLVKPYLENPHTVAVGGSVRVANGCQVKDGLLTDISVPRNIWALFQLIEYLRAFHFVRVGWAAIDALPIISGAVGLFKKELIFEVGGYSQKTHAEDFEMILKLHLYHRLRNLPYHIANVPSAVCWTEVPETHEYLKRQRVRWQTGCLECLWFNKKLLFHPKCGRIGWLTVPYQVIFEGISPIIEMFGYLSTVVFFLTGFLSYEGALALLILVLGTGYLVTFITILIEEVLFATYKKPKDLLILFAASIIENFGYRQLHAFWRFRGLFDWVFKIEGKREMARIGTWQASE